MKNNPSQEYLYGYLDALRATQKGLSTSLVRRNKGKQASDYVEIYNDISQSLGLSVVQVENQLERMNREIEEEYEVRYSGNVVPMTRRENDVHVVWMGF